MSLEFASVLLMAASVAFFAAIKGRHPERWCAAVIFGGIIVDRLIFWLGGPRSFVEFDIARFVIDGVAFLFLMVIALRANRLYPLVIVAAQLVALIGSISALAVPAGMAQAYWAMTQLPLFIQLTALAAGIVAHRRRLSQFGPYDCWSPSNTGRADPA